MIVTKRDRWVLERYSKRSRIWFKSGFMDFLPKEGVPFEQIVNMIHETRRRSSRWHGYVYRIRNGMGDIIMADIL